MGKQAVGNRRCTGSRKLRFVLKGSVAFVAVVALALSLFSVSAFASFSDSSTDVPEGEVAALELDKDAEVTITSGAHVWFSFTTPQTGWYELYSKDNPDSHIDTYGALYRVASSDSSGTLRLIASNDDGAGKSQFSIKYKLKADTTYYLACSANSLSAGTYTVCANAFDTFDISRMSINFGTVPFLAGKAVDVRALGIYTSSDYDNPELRIGHGLEIVGDLDGDWDRDAAILAAQQSLRLMREEDLNYAMDDIEAQILNMDHAPTEDELIGIADSAADFYDMSEDYQDY